MTSSGKYTGPVSRRNVGYTLVEILGAFFIMTIILTLVTGIFVENGRQRAASLGMMNEGLSAAATIEQIAADLEGALFLTSQDGRPDENPWRFASDGFGDLGADSLRLVTQNAPVANPAQHASNWVEVAYFVEENDEGNRALWRWLSPRPPSDPSSRFPNSGDEGSVRLAIDVDAFGFRFLDTDGEWQDEWDSAYRPPESPLPGAVEFNLRLLREARLSEATDGSDKIAARLHSRRIVLPMPPLDVAALIELATDDDEEEDTCFTVSDCMAEGDTGWYEDLLDDDCGGDEDLCDELSNSSTTCWSDILALEPGLANQAPSTCASR